MALDKLALALQGFGAGVQGQGPQFANMLDQRQQRQQEQQAAKQKQQQELSEERRKAWATDFRNILTHAKGGHHDRAATLINNRLSELAGMPGADPASTEYLKELADAGEWDEVVSFLEPIDMEAVNYGYLEPMQGPERIPSSEITNGNVVTANPDGTFSTQQVLSTEQMGGQEANSQFGGQIVVKDEAGNEFFASTRRDPNTGQMATVLSPISGDPSVQPQGRLQQVNDMGQTPGERTREAGVQAGTEAAAQAAIRASENAFEQLGPIRQSIATYDDTLELLNDPEVDTGPIRSRLPSFRDTAVKLDNLQARMGLDIVGNTTFGALSESELKFALDTALPQSLEPAELRKWVADKKAAQEKLSRELELAASYLGTPGNTIPGYLEMMRNLPPPTNDGPDTRQNIGPGIGPSSGAAVTTGQPRFVFNPETGRLEPR